MPRINLIFPCISICNIQMSTRVGIQPYKPVFPHISIFVQLILLSKIVSFNVCPHFFLILGFRFQLGTINFYFFLLDIQKFLTKILFIDYKYGDVPLFLVILPRHSVRKMFEAWRIHLKRGLFATLRQC